MGLVRNPALAHDIPIWQVARATSAAPTYFKPAKIDKLEYLDGGFGATNNPCMEILDEVRIMNNRNKDCVNTIVSIGTGKNSKVSRWTKSKRPGSRYLNYLNFAKKWASESETTHQKMLKEQKTLAFDYFRFNVEEGLDRMKLDEWHARGSSRVTVGKCVDSIRRKFKRTKHVERDDLDQREKPDAANDSSSTLSQAGPPFTLHTRVPKWLQPRNKTLEVITKHTEAYLEDPAVQSEIKRCAKVLVKGRRERARNDPQRWEKACFDTWYRCTIAECPRGEKVYHDRKKFELHVLDKHRSQFRKTPAEEKEKLDHALDTFKIIVQ